MKFTRPKKRFGVMTLIGQEPLTEMNLNLSSGTRHTAMDMIRFSQSAADWAWGDRAVFGNRMSENLMDRYASAHLQSADSNRVVLAIPRVLSRREVA